MSTNSRLGKGISSIFGADVSQMLEDIQNGQNQNEASEPIRLPLDQIRPNPYQPRKVFDEAALQELAASIEEHGVFTPILVRKSIQGYELIAGERRLRASRLASQPTIPAILVDFDDQQMMEISLLENIQRENLNVIEEARAYEQLIRNLHYTQEQLASRVGKSREHIANLMRLLKLPDSVSEMVVDKRLSMGHARALLPLKDKASMIRLANDALEQNWSVRTMESKVRSVLERRAREQNRTSSPAVVPSAEDEDSHSSDSSAAHHPSEADHRHLPADHHAGTSAPSSAEDDYENLFLKEACTQLESYFQTPVKIRPGSIVIHYEDNRDLTRILELLSLTDEAE